MYSGKLDCRGRMVDTSTFVYSSEVGERLGKRHSNCTASIQGNLRGRRREGIEQFWVRGTSWSGSMSKYDLDIFPLIYRRCFMYKLRGSATMIPPHDHIIQYNKKGYSSLSCLFQCQTSPLGFFETKTQILYRVGTGNERRSPTFPGRIRY